DRAILHRRRGAGRRRDHRPFGLWRCGGGAANRPVLVTLGKFEEEVLQMSIAQPTELKGRRGRIVVHRWTTAKPRFVALVAHGYGEHAGRYAHIAAGLVAEGADVSAPDFQGQGRSHVAHARSDTIDDL